MKPTRPHIYSYGVVPIKKFEGDIHFLLVRHRAGHWNFPKGRREEGEANPVQTALRELEEEGCVSECRLLSDVWFEDTYQSSHNGIDHDKTVRFFLGIVFAESAPHDDPDGGIIERKWLTYDTALEMLTYPRNKEMLKRAKEYIEAHPELWNVRA